MAIMPNTLNVKVAMQPIKTIELERFEGLSAEAICKSFKAANQILLKWSTTAPKGGTYDKCGFTVEWEDGKTFSGRYDLVHFSRRTDEGTGRPDLIAHIMSYCEYVLNDPDYHRDHVSAQDYLDNYLPQRNYAKVKKEVA